MDLCALPARPSAAINSTTPIARIGFFFFFLMIQHVLQLKNWEEV
jgi:hypothetical protein